MSSLHVNLLRPSEARHQGAVSRSFAITMAAWGGGALVLLLFVIWMANTRMVNRQLTTSREVWAAMEPRYERVVAMQDQLAEKRAVQKELEGWQNSRIDWREKLTALRSVVPADMQFTKLTVRSEFLQIGGEIRKSSAARKNNAEPKSARQFSFNLIGKAVGDRADETVVLFVDALRHGDRFEGTLEGVKLQGMQRTNARDGRGDGERIFAIEGRSPIKEM